MHLKSYQKIAVKVHDAAMQASCNVMSEAARIVRKTLGSSFAGDQALQDVSVSYDGIWHKKDHTSHFGVGVAIEQETGLVLDYAVVSNYCHGCSLGPKEGAEVHRKCKKTTNQSARKTLMGHRTQ